MDWPASKTRPVAAPDAGCDHGPGWDLNSLLCGCRRAARRTQCSSSYLVTIVILPGSIRLADLASKAPGLYRSLDQKVVPQCCGLVREIKGMAVVGLIDHSLEHRLNVGINVTDALK